MLEAIRSSLLGGYILYERSLRQHQGIAFALAKDPVGEKFLYVRGEALPTGFSGREAFEGWCCPLTPQNAFALQEIFGWLKPRSISIKQASFGFGDRLGIATPGHVRAIRGRNIIPVFAQQSIREMDRTRRRPEEVMTDAIWGIFQEGYTSGFGADADHLKTLTDLERTIPVGFTLYTCDPSDHVNDRAVTLPPKELKRKFERLEDHKKLRGWYLNRRFEMRDPETEDILQLEFTEEELLQTAVKYFRAVQHAILMYQELKSRLREFDYEISVDETESPTTPKEYFFIINELQRAGVRVTGLAPRFVGEFQKGIDYVGDLAELEKQLQAHAIIARALGPYKISVHSGSDKFRIYSLIRRHFGALFHIKTAGTSYLEALRLVSVVNPELFREVYHFALSRFAEDKQSYQIITDPSAIPSIDKLPDDRLPGLLEENSPRQLLHVTYGSILTGKDAKGDYFFRDELMKTLKEHEEEYYELLERHFSKHLDLLK